MDNAKIPKFFICEKCDYKTSRESQWKRHLLTYKHKNDSSDSSKDILDNKKFINEYKCECGKVYSYITGLYMHKKKFHIDKNNTDTNNDNKMSDK